MSQTDGLRRAMRKNPTPSRRERRAARTCAQALSPIRIFFSLLSLPVLAVSVALSVYIRTSDYDPPDALAHLVARFGCGAATSIGLAPSYRGGLGYHARNDPDGDGVACDVVAGFDAMPVQAVENSAPVAAPVQTRDFSQRMSGGAKFVKP